VRKSKSCASSCANNRSSSASSKNSSSSARAVECAHKARNCGAAADPATRPVVTGDMASAVRPASRTTTEAPQAISPRRKKPPTSIHIKGITLTPGGLLRRGIGLPPRMQRALYHTRLQAFHRRQLAEQAVEFNASGRHVQNLDAGRRQN